MVGCGIIGQGVLPLILRHIEVKPKDITIITADDRGHAIAQEYGIRFIEQPVTKDNFKKILSPLVQRGDFLLNLSINVGSVDLIKYCQEVEALYFDTCIEPWEGGYTDPNLTPSQRSNYALREAALALRTQTNNGPTAVLAHGANPGLVSHFVKRALLTIASDLHVNTKAPTDRAGWAKLASDLGIKVIHIAERDTQVSKIPKRIGEFVNTWSVDGFVGEGSQPAELGWGTHERHWPADGGHHDFGCLSAIYLNRPGASVRVRSWTPKEGPYHGFLITHNEAISIADYLTVRHGKEVMHRPTVHYAYHPCNDAILSIHELAGKGWHGPDSKRFMMDEITEGTDELGVLLMGHDKGCYWYGSVLSTDEARSLVPHNNATSLQVCSSVLAGVAWALQHPNRGIVEADDMDYEEIIDMCLPYLGKLVGKYSDWTPLQGRSELFTEDVDRLDPWQFKNFRVV